MHHKSSITLRDTAFLFADNIFPLPANNGNEVM